MRIALAAGAAVLALAGTVGARAETIYVTEPDVVVAPGYAYTAEPNYVVRERSYVVAEPPAVVVAPPPVAVAPRRERVIVAPRREVVVEQPAYVAPRDSFAYRGTWRGNGGMVTTSYSSTGACVIDINGFERCY